jgi:SNF2 family DNA or RNA helicase
LGVCDFHGEGRAKTCEALLEYDVVLTTCHTLAAEWKGRRVLHDIGWFRVVLDEGKYIIFAQTWFSMIRLSSKVVLESTNTAQDTGYETNPLSYLKPPKASRLREDGA